MLRHRSNLKWSAGFVKLCVRRFHDDDTPMPKHVGVTPITNFFMIYILLYFIK